jgi:cytochrome c peroxidase
MYLLLLAAAAVAPLGLDPYMPVPAGNPSTPAKVALGRRLFSERQLSRDGSISCATCHDPRRAFTDDRPVARGIDHQDGTRRVPVLINRGYGSSFFWDGRAATLEDQVLQPILNPKEMGMTVDLVLRRLRQDRDYARAFAVVFGRGINARDLACALACYVRGIRSAGSPFDRYLAGEKGALTAEQEAGAVLFSSKANCWFCHSGANFSDEQFHNTGVGGGHDEGRYAVTHDPGDRGAFKTPTLREVARTAPYMHDGSLQTLEDVVEHYDRGGGPNPTLDPALKPLHLTAPEKRALVAFLRALSGIVTDSSVRPAGPGLN